jgi:hypothetical protein
MSGSNSITYNSIYILPVLNYDRYIKTVDSSWLESSHIKKTGTNYENIWQLIEDEIIDEFGLDSKTKEEVTMVNDLLILEIDLELTGNNKLKNTIRKLSQQLEELQDEKKGQPKSTIKTLLGVGRVFGYRFDPATTTVFEYIEAVKSAESISQQKNKRNEH